MSAPSRPLRSHQRSLFELVAALARGEASGIADILAAVTPGGGKSLLPVIAASKLIGAGLVDRVVWVVPRDSLRLQAEEAFADPAWRAAFGHALAVRAADNAPDPSRGLSGYVTTYQAVAAAPALHLSEMRRHRTLLVVDEVHHLPALADGEADGAANEAASWSRALLPLFREARLRLLLSGTLERADGRRILWLPYRTVEGAPVPDIEAPGWAVIGYSRAEALAEKAVLPVNFGALDGEASWLEGGRTAGQARVGPHRLSGPGPSATTRPALFTALRTGFARDLLREAFHATRRLRAERRRRLGLGPAQAVRGLGKLLVVAPDQASAQSYHAMLQAWMPEEQAQRDVRIATSAEADAHAALAAFRLTPEPAVLVTVAMAYEGLDAPEVAVVAALTHIRSRPWLEQMIARATRVDPHAGDYADQHALVFHPDDPLFARFRARIETEQATATRPRKRPVGAASPEPTPLARETDEGIVPLESNALGLRYAMLRPGPAVAMARLGPQADAAEPAPVPPSRVERALRARVAAMVTAQAVEDEAELRLPRGGPLPHRYNAVLKRLFNNKSRAAMTAEELEAALAWLERNRLQDHLHLLEGDARYAWSARRRWAGAERRPG
ncbi:DEAD/DEAH box helicase [Methylobacterium nonmethylotrophicum]|uniref:Restriction endonuclease subunit R n=1 Tax=Methylobacterium nonmethylotrophicum TaxID=1141884 RepID=A0A4Z0NEZ2_9HYPH|nr:DEAD/DEAH box helicase family protein [Methylobacterium nonmethylotrophicum]TGD94793.1 restriction endonuclease subunit R [Methylobacterium nonmethylotrophicum]